MSDIDTGALRSEHTPWDDGLDGCSYCGDSPFPCQVIQLCDLVDKLRHPMPGSIDDARLLDLIEYYDGAQTIAEDTVLALRHYRVVLDQLAAVEKLADAAEWEAGPSWPDGVAVWTAPIYRVLGIDPVERLGVLFPPIDVPASLAAGHTVYKDEENPDG